MQDNSTHVNESVEGEFIEEELSEEARYVMDTMRSVGRLCAQFGSSLGLEFCYGWDVALTNCLGENWRLYIGAQFATQDQPVEEAPLVEEESPVHQ